MKQFTDNHRKIFLGAGIFALIAAIVTLGISIGRGGGFLLGVPLLMIVGAILIILANKK